MASIKIPKEVWNLIIDKIEPEPFKMPEYIYARNIFFRFDTVTQISGPQQTSSGKRFRLYVCNAKREFDIDIYENVNPRLYKKLEAFAQHYIK